MAFIPPIGSLDCIFLRIVVSFIFKTQESHTRKWSKLTRKNCPKPWLPRRKLRKFSTRATETSSPATTPKPPTLSRKFAVGSEYLIRRFPLRHIGAFRSLPSDCARLRNRKMQWLVSKRRASVFVRYHTASITNY